MFNVREFSTKIWVKNRHVYCTDSYSEYTLNYWESHPKENCCVFVKAGIIRNSKIKESNLFGLVCMYSLMPVSQITVPLHTHAHLGFMKFNIFKDKPSRMWQGVT